MVILTVTERLSNISQKIIELCFYSLFFLTPFIFLQANSELFELPKMYFIYTLTTIIVGLWAIKSIVIGRFIFRRTFLDIPLLLFLASQVSASYFSVDLHTSIFGYYSRINGGLLSLISYLLLYWAYVSNMTQKNTLCAIRFALIAAFLTSIWAILEHFGFSPSCYLLREEFSADCWIQDVQTRPFATFGQPNWLAAWLVALAPLSIILAMNNKLKATSLKSFFSLAACYLLPVTLLPAIFFTKSRSGLLGLGAAAGVYVFFLLPKKTYLKLGYLLIVGLASLTLWQYNLADCFELNPNQLTTSVGTESCKIRTIVWKGAIDIWRANPILGTGPETFAYSYYQHRPIEHNLTSEWELLYNKAHNEYLNFLANTGLVGLTTYILLISSFLLYSVLKISNFKFQISNSKWLSIALLSGYISILVTNFFGFSTSVLNLLFFLYPAMALSLSAVYSTQVTAHRLNPKKIFLLVCVLFTVSYLLLHLVQYWSADSDYNQAVKYGKLGLYQEEASKAKDALFKRSDEPVYYNEIAETASYLALDQYETGDKALASELTKLAIDSSEAAIIISPFNLNFLKDRAILFSRLSLIDPAYINQALQPLEKAISLAPTDPKVHYQLGIIYERAGKTNEAEAMLARAIELKSNYKDAYLGLAELYAKNGQREKASEKLEFILTNIDSQDREVKEALAALHKN